MGLLGALMLYGRMIKFSHSIFALPFALSGAVLAGARYGITWAQVGLIVVAMVSARSAAMGFNRLVDRHLDAANPRTAKRELPLGLTTPVAVAAFVAVSAAVFILAAGQLNHLCLQLSPAVLVVLLGYSYTKRFTWASHLALGLSLGAAPLGAWVAVSGRIEITPALLGLAVLAWVAGFDVIYASQDVEFDRKHGLRSIPAVLGVVRALHVARALHGLALALMVGAGLSVGLHEIYWAGLVAIGGLLLYEHRLVRADDLSGLNMAFFTMNGIISVAYFAFTLADLLVLGDMQTLLSRL
jgi:4-hydroxybenzoate polyprenyltransferase